MNKIFDSESLIYWFVCLFVGFFIGFCVGAFRPVVSKTRITKPDRINIVGSDTTFIYEKDDYFRK